MRLPEVMFFYLLIGTAVGLYVYRQTGSFGPMSTLLWPLWLPALMAPGKARYDTGGQSAPPDALVRLERVLQDWDQGLVPSLDTLRTGLVEVVARRTALHRELVRPENDLVRLRERAQEPSSVGAVYRRRLENVEAMGALHAQLDLEVRTALAQVEELTSRVQLARFGGATVEGVGAQLAQLVAAIDGVREIEGLG